MIELLTVLAIMGVMLGLSVVAFRDMGRGSGMRGATLQFKSHLSLARQQAITKRAPVRVVFANTNDITGWRGFYYLATEGIVFGGTNFLPHGIQFAPIETATPQLLEYKSDGTFNADVGTGWNIPSSGRRRVAILEGGPRAITNEFRLHLRTGRVKVLSGTLD